MPRTPSTHRSRGPKHPTLADVARAAEVDPSTVSRTLRRGEDSARTERARRIWAVARALDYRPNLAAAALRTNFTRLIAVFIPRLRDEVLALMYEGIEETLEAAGYQCVVLATGDDPDVQLAKLQIALQRRVDGVLVGDAVIGSPFLARVRAAGIPCILFNRPRRGYRSITIDDRAGGRLAAEHLLARVEGPLAVYGAMDHAQNLIHRVDGFLDACRAAGRAVDPDLVFHGGLFAEDGLGMAERLLALPDPPRGIFAVNDAAAVGVLGEYVRHGARPGEDVFVIGFNNVFLARVMSVPLTTVASPMRELGAAAATALLELMAGGRPTSRVMPVELLVRASTGGPGRRARPEAPPGA
ncbi:LacI family DNA-binding transcriptional regulator [Kocuria sp. SM24M-10]|uniref:LacI family DNA-binding transcriptional regulator n=1 Tax=Kocuria sp. SM24M-10 TaxID=1660349 RepID=UPI00064B1607|nr:LacI family DNA-binding transcriptional regulator [Kocuria sp. SM24M-10]KLU09642.1 hypothetical protein ABL57_11595 [Kocuria sp. SM24M-10]